MSEQAVLIVVQIASLAATCLVLAITGTWQLGKVRDELAAAISKHRQDMDGELSVFRKEFGETFTALRQKINDVELDAYKNFVRRESFYEVINGFRQAIDSRMDKLEKKLDKVISQHPSSQAE